MENPDSVMVAPMPLNDDYDNDSFEQQHEKYINIINFHRKHSSKNKAILSFKYDELAIKVTIIQIIIILFSTAISFLESIKSHFELSQQIFNIVTIVLSTSIALIMAIYRFLKYEEQKESVKNAIQDHVFIINKFRKIYSQIEHVKDKPDGPVLFDKIIDNFENEIFDNYISIRENFDTIFSFKDTIYYKNKYKNNLLKLEKTNNELDIIDSYKHDDIVFKPTSWYESMFCCKPYKIDYDTFLENGKIKHGKEKEEREKKALEIRTKKKELHEERLALLKNRADKLETFIINKNQILEDELNYTKSQLHNRDNAVRQEIYRMRDQHTASPEPVRRVRQKVRFHDNNSDIIEASPTSTITCPSPVDATILAYENTIQHLRKELAGVTSVHSDILKDKETEYAMLRAKTEEIHRMYEQEEQLREAAESENRRLNEMHNAVYCSAPSDVTSEDDNRRIINDLQQQLAANEAANHAAREEIKDMNCLLAKKSEEVARLKMELESNQAKPIELENIALIIDNSQMNRLEANDVNSDSESSESTFI